MTRHHATCLAIAVLPAATTVYVDTRTAALADWTAWMFAVDFAVVLACWFVLTLAAAKVLAAVVHRSRHVDRGRLDGWLESILPSDRAN